MINMTDAHRDNLNLMITIATGYLKEAKDDNDFGAIYMWESALAEYRSWLIGNTPL